MIWAGLALALLTALRLAMAAILPLAPDEAYYWVWSHALAPGYVDHPPMVALWIRVGTALVGETALGVRLLGPWAAALGTVLLVDAARRLLMSQRAGLLAGALLNATLLLGVGSVIMTPDSPLLLFWTAAVWALARLVELGRRGVASSGRGLFWWMAVGLFGGLALTSKYTAAFLGIGIGLWLLVSPPMRRHLRHPGPWLGLILALAVFAPVIVWNADHGWAGFLRQGGRVTAWQAHRAAQFLGELIGGQAGLATPGIWILCVMGIGLAARHAWQSRDPGWTLVALLTVPASLYFVWYALGARVQGNWPGIIYPAAAVGAAGLLVPIGWAPVGLASVRLGPVWRRLCWPSIGLGLGVTLLAYLHAATGAIALPLAVDPIALRLADWDRVATYVEAARLRTGADFVAADQYALAAELAWTLPSDARVLGIEDRWRLFALPLARTAGARGILVRDSRDQRGFDPAVWRSAEPLGEVARADVQTLHLFLVVAVADVPDTVPLPRPASQLR